MATHSSVLAWRTPGKGEPSGGHTESPGRSPGTSSWLYPPPSTSSAPSCGGRVGHAPGARFPQACYLSGPSTNVSWQPVFNVFNHLCISSKFSRSEVACANHVLPNIANPRVERR